MRFNLVQKCFTGNTLQMSCGALKIMQYEIRRSNMCFISISLAHRHKHIHKLFSFKTCSFHPLSLWLGSNYLFQVQQLSKVQFAVQLHFLINVLLVCLNCNRICPRSNPAMYISISLDCTCLTLFIVKNKANLCKK